MVNGQAKLFVHFIVSHGFHLLQSTLNAQKPKPYQTQNPIQYNAMQCNAMQYTIEMDAYKIMCASRFCYACECELAVAK